MTMKILIAPSGFKESLGSDEVADCIAAGISRALPEAKIRKTPLVDGGEGFTKTLVELTGGTLRHATVTGPTGRPVEAHFGFLGGEGPKTAVLEMASAAGLRLVPREERDPLRTTTYGVGELIRAALDAGAQRVLIGCADSGTNDGGAGMAQALGVRLLDASGCDIGRGGGELLRLERMDLSGRDPRIGQVPIEVACNFQTVLCGPDGVSRVFAPQKGASPQAVERLATALDHYAAVIDRDMDIDVRTLPGGGAAGGLGAGLRVFLNATLCWRYDVIMRYLELDGPLREADLVVTGEGCLDFTTVRGKVPAEVARRAKPYGAPVIALVGMIGEGAPVALAHGIDSYASILEAPVTLSEAMENARELLTRAAERVMRLVLAGQRLGKSTAPDEAVPAFQGAGPYPANRRPALRPEIANRLGEEFLYRVSLDLRAPLALAVSYAEMIGAGLFGEVKPEQEKALDQVVEHSFGLLTAINGLLQTAQGRDGIKALERQDSFE